MSITNNVLRSNRKQTIQKVSSKEERNNVHEMWHTPLNVCFDYKFVLNWAAFMSCGKTRV